MPTYNGVTFDIIDERGQGIRPVFATQKYQSRQHYPESNLDEVQFGGKGDSILKCKIVCYSLANYNTLDSSWGDTARTLTNLYATGDDYVGVKLTDVKLVEVAPDGYNSAGTKTGWWIADAEFAY